MIDVVMQVLWLFEFKFKFLFFTKQGTGQTYMLHLRIYITQNTKHRHQSSLKTPINLIMKMQVATKKQTNKKQT